MSNIRKVFNNGEKVELPIWNGKTPYALYYNGECVWKNGEDKPKHFIVTVWNVTDETFTFPALTMGKYTDNSGTIITQEYLGIIGWGDGTEEKYNSAYPLSHTYNSSGTYTITLWIDVTELMFTKGDGTVPYYDSNGMNYECFRGRKDLIGIDTENSILTESVAYMFVDCLNLQNVKFNNSLYFGGGSDANGNTFENCENLMEISLPSATNFINYSMFENCKNLKSLTVKSSSFGLGAYALCHCLELKTIDFSKCTTIGDFCIYDSGIQELNFGTVFNNSKGSAWYNFGINVVQNKFLNISFSQYNQHFTIIDNCVYCRFTSSGDYTYFVYCLNTSSGDIKIKNGTTRLCKYAFKDGNSDGKNSYTKSHYLNGITSITIPKSITQIDTEVFETGSLYGSGTFYSNNQIVTFYYEGTSEEWNEIAPSYRYFPTGNPLICLGDE